MELSKIVNGLNCRISGDGGCRISGIEIDSRKVKAGDMFVCLVGERFNGNDHAVEAVKNGAVAVMTEYTDMVIDGVTIVYTTDARAAYSVCCNNFFDRPNRKLKTVAIAGTNGKTTSSYILKSVLEQAGYKVGVIGTLGVNIADEKSESNMTTPDSFDFNKYLALMAEKSVDFAIAEVSAHAIYYSKTRGIVFDYAVFTNFSEDHLDFFVNMKNYFLTKLSFFNSDNVKLAVVNSDDELGKTILNGSYFDRALARLDDTGYSVRKFYKADDYRENFEKFENIQKFSYGINNPSDVFAIDLELNGRAKFIVNAFDDIFEIESGLAGRHNAYNALGVIALSVILGVSKVDIYKGIAKLKYVEGRYNVFDKNGYRVIVDFAHTEDGLSNLLDTVKADNKGRLITLFGCGGNRDKEKREKMGKVASIKSDIVILTSDNPRYEKPRDIIAEIERGVSCPYFVIEDREAAIRFGIGMLKKDDVLVVAGKGGEKTQEINGIFYEQNDNAIVEKILRSK